MTKEEIDQNEQFLLLTQCFPLLVIGYPNKICSKSSAAELSYEGKGKFNSVLDILFFNVIQFHSNLCNYITITLTNEMHVAMQMLTDKMHVSKQKPVRLTCTYLYVHIFYTGKQYGEWRYNHYLANLNPFQHTDAFYNASAGNGKFTIYVISPSNI